MGHTHEDVDAIIGKVLGGIRDKDMFTFPQYESKCGESLVTMSCRVIKCCRLIALPDYDKIFQDFNCSNVQVSIII